MSFGYTFRALKHRDFRSFWLGQMISLIGTWMQRTAQAWLVFSLTNSPFYLGLVYSVSYFPIFILSTIAGAVADRTNKRNLLMATQVGSMIQAFILATLTITGLIGVWHIVLLGGILGVINAFDAPTRHSIIRDLVGMEDLRNAIALNSSIFNAARMLGPVIAGVLIPIMGEAGCFYLNGFSFLAIILGLFLIRPIPSLPRETGSFLADLKEGFTYIRRDTTIFMLLTTVGITSIFAMPFTVLMPVFARDILGKGPEALGFLMAAVGIGAIFGVLRMASGISKSNIHTVVIRGIALSVFLILFSLSSRFCLSLVFLFVVGWTLVTKIVTINSLIQQTVPDRLRARVMSMYILMLLGMMPIGSFFAGTAAQMIGAPWTVRISGFILGAYMLLFAKVALPKQPEKEHLP